MKRGWRCSSSREECRDEEGGHKAVELEKARKKRRKSGRSKVKEGSV